MRTCPLCHQNFEESQQTHICRDQELNIFLSGKPAYAVMLFDHLEKEYHQVGNIKASAAKTMIGFGAQKKFAYVIYFGKNFLDVVFPFKQAYSDNLCFNKIKPVPGSDDFNHHLRLYFKEDINDEVRMFMKLAYEQSLN